jgi:hypothetical protein
VDGAGLDELGGNAFDVARVYVLDERAGKAILLTKKYADFFHRVHSLKQRCKPWIQFTAGSGDRGQQVS